MQGIGRLLHRGWPSAGVTAAAAAAAAAAAVPVPTSSCFGFGPPSRASSTDAAAESARPLGGRKGKSRTPVRATAKAKLAAAPGLGEFMRSLDGGAAAAAVSEQGTEAIPYVDAASLRGDGRSVFLEVYGCQMNVNDAEIAWSILEGAGYARAATVQDADVALMVTCAIREGAERKVFGRIRELASIKRDRRKLPRAQQGEPLKIGVLGCMAERLKTKLIEQEKAVDLVVGPDAYRDLPRLLMNSRDGQAQINVQLSMDETYADVSPVRMHPDSPSAFVSIMRGCDNMCSYCIVPFTRGRERSRDVASVLNEVKEASEAGIKEMTLLGQNVNSYRDLSDTSAVSASLATVNSDGFATLYKNKEGGLRFAELLHQVSQVDPTMRVRFTSPHPKDFPDELLHVIRDTANICNYIHLPAQSGSTEVLDQMRRGYSKESYLELVDHIRSIIPDVTFSTDMIAGFCGETEADHLDSVDLLDKVKFNQGFLYAFSMRAKTSAYHKLVDDVPEDVKQARLNELIQVFQKGAKEANGKFIGSIQHVLVEGTSRRSADALAGRSDGNIKTIFPLVELPTPTGRARMPRVGDTVAVEILSSTSMTMKGNAVYLMND